MCNLLLNYAKMTPRFTASAKIYDSIFFHFDLISHRTKQTRFLIVFQDTRRRIQHHSCCEILSQTYNTLPRKGYKFMKLV